MIFRTKSARERIQDITLLHVILNWQTAFGNALPKPREVIFNSASHSSHSFEN